MKIDISPEIVLGTARSGGKGGQNVNKVETMVTGKWNVDASRLVNAAQKELIREKLQGRINAAGELYSSSQRERTQLGNKADLLEKMNRLVNDALTVKKSRISTRPTKASRKKRIETKKRNSDKKSSRGRVDPRRFS